jgi:lysophospholipase L1-like esterase
VTVVGTLGDSQTEGYPSGDPIAKNPSYRVFLHERSNPSRASRVTMVGTKTDWYGLKHDGVSGRTTTQLLAALPAWWAALVEKPTDVPLLIGTNNIFFGISVATTKAELQSIIDTLNGFGVRVWMSLILPRSDGLAASVPTYNAQLATVTGAAAIINPGAAAGWSNALCLQPDGVHTTAHCDLGLARQFLAAMRDGDVDI